ncbi:hypothetical protein CRG98_010458 [Punica granatum]|uniref:Uncharacterized protein n=1 Tax=Punica granatum TaxID=22663 RepID=A0A2I0KLN9_PUNGR|nr:hypothetical protein CRG98_010458 [Punica granatum]
MARVSWTPKGPLKVVEGRVWIVGGPLRDDGTTRLSRGRKERPRNWEDHLGGLVLDCFGTAVGGLQVVKWTLEMDSGGTDQCGAGGIEVKLGEEAGQRDCAAGGGLIHGSHKGWKGVGEARVSDGRAFEVHGSNGRRIGNEIRMIFGKQSEAHSLVLVTLGCGQTCLRVPLICLWSGSLRSPIRKAVCERLGVPQLR